MEGVRKRVLVYSADRIAGGSTASFTVVLRNPIERAIKAEWVCASMPGYAVSIQELGDSGLTTNGQGYWRFIDSLQNGRYTSWSEEGFPPKTIRQLTIRYMNPDGTVATLPSEHMLELEFLCLR